VRYVFGTLGYGHRCFTTSDHANSLLILLAHHARQGVQASSHGTMDIAGCSHPRPILTTREAIMEYSAPAAYLPYIDELLDQLQKRAHQPVLRYQRDDVTGDSLRRAIYRYARALSLLGIGRDSVVALFAPNCPDALAIRYAANLLGAAAMYLPSLKDGKSRSVLLERIRPSLLVAFPTTAHLVPDAAKADAIYVSTGPTARRLDKLAQAQSELPLPSCTQPGDLAVIVSSGGTTGVPKGSRRSFAAYSAMVCGPCCKDRRQLVNGPLAYLSQVLVDTTLIGGGVVVLRPRYDPAATLAAIELERITDVLLVEPQLFEVMDHPDVRRRDLSTLRSIAHIGGSAPNVLLRRAVARLGPVLTHMYGASEAGMVSVLPANACDVTPNPLACAGRIRPGVEVRLRRDDGTLARNGECGRIEVRSAAVAQGYYHQELESALKFQDGGCLTGDVGFIHADGNLWVLGRASDVADMGGRMVGPTLIEEILCRLPEVRYAVAFAAGTDAVDGGWSVAVEPWAGRDIDVARCTRALEDALGTCVSHAVHICVVDYVPLTEQGKVDRAAVTRILQSGAPLSQETSGLHRQFADAGVV
jgi:fatty-acyl-CoA synthase